MNSLNIDVLALRTSNSFASGEFRTYTDRIAALQSYLKMGDRVRQEVLPFSLYAIKKLEPQGRSVIVCTICELAGYTKVDSLGRDASWSTAHQITTELTQQFLSISSRQEDAYLLAECTGDNPLTRQIIASIYSKHGLDRQVPPRKAWISLVN
jgi:hypothetical protein